MLLGVIFVYTQLKKTELWINYANTGVYYNSRHRPGGLVVKLECYQLILESGVHISVWRLYFPETPTPESALYRG